MFHKIFGIEKVYEQEREDQKEGVTRFSVKSFCLTVPKNFLGNSLVCQKFGVAETVLLEMVMSHFLAISFFHKTEELRPGTLLCRLSEIFWQQKKC